MKTAGSFIASVLYRTARRLNPLARPVIPAYVTLWFLALLFTLLYIRDHFVCNFIPGYGDLALSAWGFVLLMDFLESLMETCEEGNEEK